jgi:hypothetical protein
MDFDSRLSVLVPIATERSVTKATDLWSGYKKGKSIRNAVTHTGRQVTLSEAKEVLKTVFDWLSHLGSTAELDVLLLRLKSHIESTFDWQAAGGGTGPDFWSTYERNVRQYFAKVPFSHVETNVAVPLSAGALFEVDFLVTIGSRQVAIEVKRASANPLKLDEQLQATTQGVYRLLAALKIDSAVVVLLFDVVPPEKYRKMEKRLNGRVTILPTVMRLRR